MHYVTNSDSLDLASILSAVYRDPESWRDWRCMKIEILMQANTARSKNLKSGIRRFLETYLQGKQGTVYMGLAGGIAIFCKDVSEAHLKAMGRQIVELIKNGENVAVMFRVFELREDIEDFMKTFDKNHVEAETDKSHDSDTPLLLLPTENTKSDGLSKINGCKVLLVEDDPVTRWMVKMALKEECRLEVVADANKGLAAYKHSRPDLVLLDINLPGRNGHELMARIISADPAANIVMFSSEDSLESMVSSMASGAKGFIAKPFNKERLIQYVQNCR